MPAPQTRAGADPIAIALCSRMPKEPKPNDVTLHEVTDNAVYADERNFYKVEKWTRPRTWPAAGLTR